MGPVNKRRIELMAIDILIIGVVYGIAAFFMQFNISSVQVNGEFTILKLVIYLICIMGSRILVRLYRNIWRYANVRTYLRIMLTDMIGGFVFILLGRMIPTINLGVACSVIIIMGTILLTMASRFCYQLMYAHFGKKSDASGENEIHKINIAIIGAGNVGASLAEELLRNPRSHYYPYCFIDKDAAKAGNGLNGIPVYREDERIVARLRELPVQEIIIALPDADPEDKLRLFNLYKQTDCKVKLYDYPLREEGYGNKTGMEQRSLRELRIEDLLFRDSIKINSEKTKAFYTGKTVLVTGGGGSIGSELCRQIAMLQPKKLVIVDIYENNAYDIQQELIRKYGDSLSLEVYIASVRDVKRMDDIFRKVMPDIVFHAAAHKHVPLMEDSGCEAIKNNVFGTYNVANVAEKYHVKKFLLISTDKAVNPTNIMGASKRLCEMIIQCRKDSETEFTAVRFGNVLGSNGSVIPLFKRQLEAGGPLTLTDKRIIRYFMTIPEAVGLVMETNAMAHNGELFVLNMGKPVKILDLAENMIRLSGLRPYEDIDIVEIGLRPGEKLYEELLMKTEELDQTENEMIFIERDKGITREEMEQKLIILQEAAEMAEKDFILDAIRKTVPTYHSPEEVNNNAEQAEEMKRIV